MDVLQSYLRLERPLTNSSSLFVALKGRRRGHSMTPGGPPLTLPPSSMAHSGPDGQSTPVSLCCEFNYVVSFSFVFHRLRHTWASEMLRCGMSLPALMQLMGHKDIRMTLRYLKVTQPDLQREFYKARQNTVQPYRLPALSVSAATADLPGIRQALAATRHLLEMYRRQLGDERTRRKLQRLDKRLLTVASEVKHIARG